MEYLSFHMMMNQEELNLLNDLKNQLCLKKKSKTIDFIIQECIKIMKSLYLKSGNHRSKKPESNSRYKDVRFRLKGEYYRQMKMIHGKNNIFSIAAIVRLFLDFFDGGIKAFGSVKKFLKILKKISSNKKKRNNVRDNFLKKIHMDNFYLINSHFLSRFIMFLSNKIQI